MKHSLLAEKNTWVSERMDLLRSHVSSRIQRIYDILHDQNMDALVIASGTPVYYFEDDQHYPLKQNPFFSYLCPMTGPYHHLVFSSSSSSQIKLFYHSPQDFWHYKIPVEEYAFADLYDITLVEETSRRFAHIVSHISEHKNVAYIGDDSTVPQEWNRQPRALITALSGERMKKTPWEMACLQKATEIAVKAHQQVAKAFLSMDPATEKDLYFLYAQCAAHTESEFPYLPIIACDEHAAILHYDQRDRGMPQKQQHRGVNLLMDAGASWLGYGSDISRTTLRPWQSGMRTVTGKPVSVEAHGVFFEMCQRLEHLQRRMVQGVGVGKSFRKLHEESMAGVFEILAALEVVRSPRDLFPEDVKACAQAFYPHGLGHMLGLQVHDVNIYRHQSSQRKDRQNQTNQAKEQHKSKNKKDDEESSSSMRDPLYFAPGYVLTIEPGIYFIEQCLAKLRRERPHVVLNDPLIAELAVLGGMRVEDNVYVGEDEVKNVTREVEYALRE